MRLFVALDLDGRSRDAIAREQARIRGLLEGGAPLRWINPEQLHLTLVFLGEVDPSDAALLEADIRAPVSVEAFDLSFKGIGVFPPHGAPRALWIGARDGITSLAALQQAIAERVRHRGLALESRPFSPHLTIGRWKSSRPSDRRRVLMHGTDITIVRLYVDHATLYHSRPSSAGSKLLSDLKHTTVEAP